MNKAMQSVLKGSMGDDLEARLFDWESHSFISPEFRDFFEKQVVTGKVIEDYELKVECSNGSIRKFITNAKLQEKSPGVFPVILISFEELPATGNDSVLG
jgi:hypothetical protein